MAFPTIADADTKNGTVTSNTSNWTLTYPTNIAAGDLLLAFVGLDGTTGATFTGWDARSFVVAGCALTFAAKVAAGTETGTFSITNPSEQGGWRIFRIPVAGWFGGSIGVGSLNAHTAVGVDVDGQADASANPDPPSLDPAQWATEDTLWFAACAVDTSRTISVYPLADRNTADVSGGSGGATLGVCTTTSAVGSLDPGTFTISASDDWSAATVAVRPSASVYVPRHPAINHQNPALV